MEILSANDRAAIEKIKNTPPDFRGSNGLFSGFYRFHGEPTEPFTYETIGRAVCDVSLVVVRHRDGSSDGVLSHFLPTLLERRAHAESLEELDLPEVRGDTTDALLLTSNLPLSFSNPEEYANLFRVLTARNKQKLPWVVASAVGVVTEIVFMQRPTPDGYVQTTSVLNTDYRNEYRYKKIQKRTRRRPPPTLPQA